ncbi:MAG: BCD family MFS transporter [Candidatus Promineofilum sp.]|nr:BCD family MFS transporter [Promineifilum sp.]MCW5864376.1 BCD family MFS transporter [Anaerolineae bacterium]
MDEQQRPFTLWRGLRLSSFQIGSAMGEILITSIWNRILIINFGIPATPVALLIALRYLLSPLSLWAGNLTDNRSLFGLRRTPMIWLGRVLMVASLPFLWLSVVRLGGSTTDPWGWLFALVSSLAYGVGTLISGGPFLALVRESAPERLQGVAISMAQTVLITFFAIVGIAFSFWMRDYSLPVFGQMVLATMIISGVFWFIAIVGIERRTPPPAAGEVATAPTTRFGEAMRTIWSDRRTRLFFLFLALGTLASWSHEAILEPFGADVFSLNMDVTTRFNSYWQTATVVVLVVGGILWRKRPPEAQQRITSIGLLVMALGLALLVAAALMGQRHLLEIALLVFGGGFGVYTYGGVSLMAVMSPDRHAGLYLGLWTVSNLLFKGLGTFIGGALRDLFLLQMKLAPGLSYGVVFLLQAVGLATAALLLARIDILGFARDTGRHAPVVEARVAAAD